LCSNLKKSDHSSADAFGGGNWGGLGKLADDVNWTEIMENRRIPRKSDRSKFIVDPKINFFNRKSYPDTYAIEYLNGVFTHTHILR
jgi:hypothetical protein